MTSSEYNTPQYINNVLEGQETTLISQSSQIWIGIKIGLNVLLYGKKWLFFLLIAMIPLFLAQLVGEPLLGNDDAKTAFLELYIEFWEFIL